MRPARAASSYVPSSRFVLRAVLHFIGVDDDDARTGSSRFVICVVLIFVGVDDEDVRTS